MKDRGGRRRAGFCGGGGSDGRDSERASGERIDSPPNTLRVPWKVAQMLQISLLHGAKKSDRQTQEAAQEGQIRRQITLGCVLRSDRRRRCSLVCLAVLAALGAADCRCRSTAVPNLCAAAALERGRFVNLDRLENELDTLGYQRSSGQPQRGQYASWDRSARGQSAAVSLRCRDRPRRSAGDRSGRAEDHVDCAAGGAGFAGVARTTSPWLVSRLGPTREATGVS